MPTVHANWYDYPQYYDLAFADETRAEADFIEAACRRYATRPVRRLLEPGCGSGRMIVEMARRGYDVVGFDLSDWSLDYARRQLARRRLRANVFRADMAEFRVARCADAAYCHWDTFRHLLTEDAARRHLECVAASLRPGGIYLLGLHLLPPDASEECTERWTARRGRTTVSVTLRVIESDRRRRTETLRSSMLVRTEPTARAAAPTQHRLHVLRIQTEFRFRLYTAIQLRRLVSKVLQFELVDVFDFWFQVEHSLRLTDQLSDVVLVLRRRADRNCPS